MTRHIPYRVAVHPDGFFSICRIPSPLCSDGEGKPVPPPVGESKDNETSDPSGSVAGQPSLGSSVAPNSRTRSRRGLGGLTKHGKRMLRNASAILERHLSIKRVALITCTIPSTDPEILEVIAANAARITDSLSHKLQHRLRKRGLPQWVAGCWELQERGALHLHWILPSCSDRRRQDWVISKQELVSIWRETLCQLVPELTNANWAPSTRIEAIRKSVGRYLAKYLSKGAGGHKASCVPASWYHVSRALRQMIKESIFAQTWSSPKWAGIVDVVASRLPVARTKAGAKLLSLVFLPAKYGAALWGISGYSPLPHADLIDEIIRLIAPLSLQEMKGMPVSSIPLV